MKFDPTVSFASNQRGTYITARPILGGSGMDNTQKKPLPKRIFRRHSAGVALLVLLMFSATASADHQYVRDDYGYGRHGHSQYQDNTFGSYKYPRGSTAPGASLNNGPRPGDGLNANRHNNSRYPTYRNNRRQDGYNNRRFSSNRPPGAQRDLGSRNNNNLPNERSNHRDRGNRGDSGYRDGYSRGFERGYSRGRRDSQYGHGNGRVYRQNPYGQSSPYYQQPRNYGGRAQRGYGSPYQRY